MNPDLKPGDQIRVCINARHFGNKDAQLTNDAWFFAYYTNASKCRIMVHRKDKRDHYLVHSWVRVRK